MKRKPIIIVVLLILAIAGCYWGFSVYGRHKLMDSIAPHVKNTSLRLANAVEYETGKVTKITYNELFAKLESDISEIDKRILDVQTLATSSDKDITESVVTYMKGSQELLRALLAKYRKALSLSAAKEYATNSVEEIRNASYYGREYALKTSERAIKDFEKAGTEFFESKVDVVAAAKNIIQFRAKIASSLEDDVLVDPSIIEIFLKENEPKQKDIAAQAPKT